MFLVFLVDHLAIEKTIDAGILLDMASANGNHFVSGEPFQSFVLMRFIPC